MAEMLWETILQKCPGIAAAFEAKIAEEVGKKQTEIDTLKAELAHTKAALDEVILNSTGGVA